MKSQFEIGDNRNQFNSYNTAQIEKKKFNNISKTILIVTIAYLFPKFFKEYSDIFKIFYFGANK